MPQGSVREIPSRTSSLYRSAGPFATALEHPKLFMELGVEPVFSWFVPPRAPLGRLRKTSKWRSDSHAQKPVSYTGLHRTRDRTAERPFVFLAVHRNCSGTGRFRWKKRRQDRKSGRAYAPVRSPTRAAD